MFENFIKTVETPIKPLNVFDPVNDSRSEPRQRCYKTGQIILDDIGPTYDCIFKDLSWFGVRLEMNTYIPLQSSFRLALSYGKHVKSFQCKQIWRNGNEIGVIFDHEVKAAPYSAIGSATRCASVSFNTSRERAIESRISLRLTGLPTASFIPMLRHTRWHWKSGSAVTG